MKTLKIELILTYFAIIFIAVAIGFGIIQKPILVAVTISVFALVLITWFKKPILFEYVLFFLLFSGPPRFRVRDPYASLQSEIDWVVVLHVVIWLSGFAWILYRFSSHLLKGKRSPTLPYLNCFGLLLVIFLSLSMITSPGPLLTGFRSFQMLIMILFSYLWIEKFGIETTLYNLFWGYVSLAMIIALSGLFYPSLVFVGQRMRGDLIANTGAVAAIGFILLLSFVPPINRWFFLGLLVLFVFLLILSMTRSAYAVILLFLITALLRRTNILPLRRFIYFLLFLIPILYILHIMPTVFKWIIRDHESLITLSARIPLWKHLIHVMWQKSPVFGLGFYSGSRIYGPQYISGLGTAHNSFVEVLTGGGIISGFLFLLILIMTFARSLKLFLFYGKNSDKAFTIFVLLIAIICIGLVSKDMVIASPIALTFWLLVSVNQKLESELCKRYYCIEKNGPTRTPVGILDSCSSG